MKEYLNRAAGMLAGVRMLRRAMLLVLLVVTAAEVRAENMVITCSNCGMVTSYIEVSGIVKWGEYRWIKRPTCTSYGTIEYVCSHCSDDGRTSRELYYPAYGHDWGTSTGNYVAPTCTKAGGTQHTCNRCGVTECDNSAPALGHDWGEETFVPATCTEYGYYSKTCNRCTYCNKNYTLLVNDPNFKYSQALGHAMSGWITVAATCTTGGYEHNYCRRDGCNYEERRNQTAALGHDFALDHHCTRCDAVDPAQKPEGYIDHCAGGELQFSIRGWAYDANAPATSIDIHVYVYQNDGTTRYGDIHIIHADLERPDLATARGIPTNHGYSATIPIADAGTYKVKAYAIDLNGDGNPQIGATQTITVSVPYIAANGQTQNCNSATRLTGGAATTLSGGWYYVTGEVNYTGYLTLQGDANIILCDGATLNIGSSESRLTTHCILGQDYTLTVYGQGQQTGALYGYNKTSDKISAISNRYNNPRTAHVSQFTQYGGNVTFDLNVHTSAVTSPYPVEANVDFRGGHFTANGGNGIKGNVNINWSDTDDRFRTSGFGPNGTGGTVTIASGKAFTDGTNYYAGTLDNTTKVSAQGRTLWPVTAISLADNASNSTAVTKLNGVNSLDVTLSDRTLWKDGAWNTLCLPFDVNTTSAPLSGDGVKAMVLDAANSGVSGSTLTLNFTSATSIPAGTPFIIKWNNMGTTIEEPEFTGVTISNATTNNTQAFSGGSFKGTFSPVSFTANDKSILFLGAENKLYWPNADMTLGACRAYFDLGTASASKFVMNFGDDATSIRSLSPDPSPSREGSEYWYDLSGRKLSQKPTQKGVYINNGHKVVIK